MKKNLVVGRHIRNSKKSMLWTRLLIQDVYPGSGFFHPRSGSTTLKKNEVLLPKNCYQALGNMMRDVYLRSGFFSTLDLWSRSRGLKTTGSIPDTDRSTGCGVPDPGTGILCFFYPWIWDSFFLFSGFWILDPRSQILKIRIRINQIC
jgi:hypothetical protein